jgi:hypothetical protein
VFGPPWSDVDHNGCDTRNDVLRRDLAGARARGAAHPCVVVSGTLHDPYTGHTVAFRHRVPGGEVAVVEVVSLADAWRSGAASWPATRRVAFANDPLNLQTTEVAVQIAKGDRDAAAWLPPLASARCAFVARQLAVKARYRLTVSAAEHDAMATVLKKCPDEMAPA